MKHSIIVIVVLIIASVINFKIESPINIHSKDMTSTHHTFKKYNNMYDSFRGKNPIDSLVVPIDPTTNNYNMDIYNQWF